MTYNITLHFNIKETTFKVPYPHHQYVNAGSVSKILVVICLVVCGGCESKKKTIETPAVTESKITRSANATGSFTRLTPEQTGLNFVPQVQLDHRLANIYEGPFAATGIAIGDLDGDSVPDIFCAGGSQPNRLYKQVGPCSFKDVTASSNLNSAPSAWGVSGSLADIDNDGDLDIYVCNYRSENELWINDGNGAFTEKAAALGVAVNDASVMAYFGDLNRSGFLDFLLITNRYYFSGDANEGVKINEISGRKELDESLEEYFKFEKNTDGQLEIVPRARHNFVFQNRSGRKFEDVTRLSGIQGEALTNSATLWDFDNDNDLDIYVCNDKSDRDQLYENEGQFRFKEISEKVLEHTSWLSKGSATGDINNDGLPDLITVDSAGSNHHRKTMLMGDTSEMNGNAPSSAPVQMQRNFLHLNSGSCFHADSGELRSSFFETARISGVASTDSSWTPVLRDFDNDGLVDLFVTNGDIRNFRDPDRGPLSSTDSAWQRSKSEELLPEKNFAFRNMGDLRFNDSSSEWGLDLEGVSHVAATSDLDRDGDLDLIVSNLDNSVNVYRNDINTSNGLTVHLEGTRSNRFGIGAKVEIEYGNGEFQSQRLAPYNGFLASNEPLVQFGLGEHTKVKKLTVHWPTGEFQESEDLDANQLVTFVEPKRGPSSIAKEHKSLFEQVTNISIPKRAERDFDDYAQQPLLPNRLSELGPGVAIGDVNGDQREEIYVAHPRGQVKSFGLRKEKEDKPDSIFFETIRMQALDGAREEYAPLFFDIDGDRDQDLYVACGGVENGARWFYMIDTLLVNQGFGSYQIKDREVLAEFLIRGAAAAAADYDRDGDLDVFLGGRVERGEYPRSPRSMLMRNDTVEKNKPILVDATLTDSDNLLQIGMVSSCRWCDVNDDAWIDLLVATEWGPIKVFINKEGKLVEATEECGMSEFTGRWNGITTADFDNDGDMDIVATNFGYNTPYSASKTNPARLRLIKFRNREQPVIIETKTDVPGESLVRSKRVLDQAVPEIANKYPTYKDFAAATFEGLFEQVNIASTDVFEVNELGTCIFLNDGNGVFEAKPLPGLTQAAPGFGVVATDFDGDGNKDIFVAQNFYAANQDTGLLAGGLSVLLLGDGKGNFEVQMPFESGIAISGPSKGTAVADFNRDYRPDIVVGITRERPRFYYNRSTKNQFAALRLRSVVSKNTSAIGAKIEVVMMDGSRQFSEVSAGGGYLSQSTNDQFIGLGEAGEIASIKIRWPDGATTEHDPPRKLERVIEITQRKE